MSKLTRYIVSIVCIALIGLSIYYNPDVIRIKTYEELTADEPPIYTGIITIWQISSWRVAQSSKTIMLLDAAEEFEKRNKQLYIEVEILSYDDYMRKTSQGIYPDVLSFPAEMQIDYNLCTPIAVASSLDTIHMLAYEASGNNALPWMATSNIIMINSKYADKEECSIKRLQSNSDIAQSIDILSDKEEYVCGSPIAMLPLAVSDAHLETIPIVKTEYSAWLSFARKETKILYGCIWQTYAMDRLIAKQKGFSTEYIYPHIASSIFYWTQNFCVFSDEENKNQMIFDYFDLLLSEDWQIKIADSTASFPVTNIEMNYTDVRGEIAKSSQNKFAIIPGLGITDEQIIAALSGDENAKTLLKEKLVFH